MVVPNDIGRAELLPPRCAEGASARVVAHLLVMCWNWIRIIFGCSPAGFLAGFTARSVAIISSTTLRFERTSS
jgi:hypothetical protein